MQYCLYKGPKSAGQVLKNIIANLCGYEQPDRVDIRMNIGIAVSSEKLDGKSLELTAVAQAAEHDTARPKLRTGPLLAYWHLQVSLALSESVFPQTARGTALGCGRSRTDGVLVGHRSH